MVFEHAVILRDAKKKYGQGPAILNGLNMTVPKGSIYGLLGASGCGKTTLLSCLVGIRKLDHGEVWVLGGKPGSKESGIPGPCIGYMPQDVSLVEEFSMIGALYFFGKINGLDNYTIEERYLYLKDLLQLPPRNSLVKNMSGGQQRRASFAAALLHKPDLLILDEPTVGLDPVLRDNIWNYLVKITQDEGVTVIVTTHYIEEARQADKIGLMRCGQLLAESSPADLLNQCHTDSLEEAFLSLSKLQAQNQQFDQLSNTCTQRNDYPHVDVMCGKYVTQSHNRFRSSRTKRCQALLMKNALQFMRHPGGVVFSIILPVLQVLLFFNTIGLDPKGLSISVVNEEAGNCDYGRNRGNVVYDSSERMCSFEDLSCRFLAGINSSKLAKVYYDSYDEARQNIARDKSAGIMYFRRNFSSGMEEKLADFLSVSNAAILASQVEVTLHSPDRQITLFVQKMLSENFFDDLKDIVEQCGVSPKFASIPIHFEEPIFGTMDQNFVTFVAPPFILSEILGLFRTLFVMATSICSGIIITDRNSGVWDRSLVQGVTITEILVTHLISQVSVIIIQVTLALCLSFLHFELQCKGSLSVVFGLSMLAGICGMSYGFLISVICTSHSLVNYASVGSFYPLVLLCGLIWPIEGMPKFLRWFSLILPTTLPGMSLRGVMEKGTPVDEPEVYTGFIVVAAWILGLMSLCLFHMRVKAT